MGLKGGRRRDDKWSGLKPSRVASFSACLPRLLLLWAALCVGLSEQLLHAVSPELGIEQYNLRTWRRDNGLPANGVFGIAVGADGRLWLGTSKGVVHFDGTVFQVVDQAGGASIQGQVILTVSPRKEGGVWFGLNASGYGYYDGQRIVLPAPEDWMEANATIQSILEARDGRFYVVGQQGAGVAVPGGPLKLITPPGLDVQALHEDRQGRVWMGTAERGLFYWENDTLHPFPDPTLRTRNIQEVTSDSKGNLWVATPNGIHGFDRTFAPLPVPPLNGQPDALLVDRHDVVWIGTRGGGVLRYKDGNYSNLRIAQGLPSNAVLALAESQDGSIWIGTTEGLTQLSDVKFPIYSSTEGYSADAALTVAAGADGSLWSGSPSGLSHLKDGVFRTYGMDPEHNFRSRWVKHVYPARNGDVYLIGARKNIDRFRNGRVDKTWIHEVWPRAVAEDSRGIIVALKDELMRLENDTLVPYLLKDGSPVKLAWVNQLVVAPNDSVWVATERGVYQITQGRLINWCEASGLGSDRYHFLSLMEDGTVWAAQKHGIARIKDGAMVMVTRAHGLHDAGPYALVADRQGGVWMDSNSGIFRVSAAELNAVADGRLPRLTSSVFDGPESARTTDKIVQDYSGCRTGDGHIWFPTSKGVLRVDPSRIRANTTPPRPSIVAWRINGQAQDINATAADVQPGAGNVEIDYSALEYQAPQKVQYRYRLLGSHDTWFEAGTRRSAFYPSLGPGNYVFEVQARNADSDWSTESASLRIGIRPRFFETLAFRISCIGVLATLGLYLAWVLHMHRRQKELERTHALMERKVQERTSELAEANSHLRIEIEQRKQAQAETERLHDELRTTARIAQEAARAKSQFLANMSHEIRTPMNGVIGMSNLLLHTALDDQQRELAETTRNSAEALLTVLNDILDFSKVEAGKLVFEQLEFDLREAVEESAELLAVRASAQGVELATFLAPDLAPRWRGDPARLRQVLLNLIGNAVKFTEKGSIVVRVSLEPPGEQGGRAGVRFQITDSGIGIAAEAQQKLFQPFTQADDSTTRRFGGTGLGLAISRQIVEHMGGRIGMSSTVGAGSTFWFTVPLLPSAATDYLSAGDRATLGKLRVAAAFPDSALMREVLEHQAQCLGFRLTQVQDFGAIQERLEEERRRGDPFHVVLVGSKDAQFARTVAANLNAWGQTSAIAVCAHPVDPEEGGAGGAILFNLSPPLRTRALVRALIAAGVTPPPAMQVPAATVPQPSRPPLSEAFRDLRIVVAEDNPVNQRVVELQLRKLGCTARIVGNGVQVLEALRATPADVVLMDCQMPVMDGYEATRELRKDPTWNSVYVIAMTANSMEGDREKCLAAGMNDYLAKPTRERDLVEALHRAAAGHRATAPS